MARQADLNERPVRKREAGAERKKLGLGHGCGRSRITMMLAQTDANVRCGQKQPCMLREAAGRKLPHSSTSAYSFTKNTRVANGRRTGISGHAAHIITASRGVAYLLSMVPIAGTADANSRVMVAQASSPGNNAERR